MADAGGSGSGSELSFQLTKLLQNHINNQHQNPKPSDAGEIDGGFVTKKYRRNDGKKKGVTRDNKFHLKCNERDMERHTEEECLRRVGYPDWWSDGTKKGTKLARSEKEKSSTTNTSSASKKNTGDSRDGRRSVGVFGGAVAARTEKEESNFSLMGRKCENNTHILFPQKYGVSVA